VKEADEGFVYEVSKKESFLWIHDRLKIERVNLVTAGLLLRILDALGFSQTLEFP
jgi:hypothetical protein